MESQNKIIVPIPFRSGEQEVSSMQVVRRIADIEAKKSRTDAAFEQFKRKFFEVKQ